MSSEYFEGIGRRKRATARVRMFPGGSGNIIVNDKQVDEYFPRAGDTGVLREPLRSVDLDSAVDITARVMGGGVTGQRDAVRMGIARAIVKYDEQMQPSMRTGGFLTRDPREKERKKPGLKRARKAPTYTKR